MGLRDETMEYFNASIERAVGKIDPKVVEVSFIDKFKGVNRPENSHQVKKATVINLGDRPVTIIPISDIHLGSKGCNLKKLETVLQIIDETPDCYTIFMGDQAETATRTSVGLGVFDEDFHLPEQIKILKSALKPLVKKGKVLGMLTGNHEMRTSYDAKFNSAEEICNDLDIPYFKYQGYLLLKVGKQNYHIFASHGAGGGTTAAGKLNAARRPNTIALADIYLTGHTHGRIRDDDIIFRINETTGIVEPFRRYYVVCGSFMEYWDTYPEMKLLSPSLTGVMMIKLDSRIKDIQIIS